MHMLVSMYYCIYMFSYGPYGPEIKHYYIIIIIIILSLEDSKEIYQHILIGMNCRI